MKTASGNYFEDFALGMRLVHATPRTVTEGDVALYTALYGPRFGPTNGLTTARAMGLERMPLDDLLTFHVVFGKTVPDISLNAVANLGYAGGRFGVRVRLGDAEVMKAVKAASRSSRRMPNIGVLPVGCDAVRGAVTEVYAGRAPKVAPTRASAARHQHRVVEVEDDIGEVLAVLAAVREVGAAEILGRHGPQPQRTKVGAPRQLHLSLIHI